MSLQQYGGRIPSGVSDQYVYFLATDATDHQTPETGLSSFTVYRSRNGNAPVVMTTPTINETSAVNMPGVYELLLDEDMTIGATNDSEMMTFHISATGMAPVVLNVELYTVNVTKINGNSTAAANLGESTQSILDGTATGTPTLTTMVSDLTFDADSQLVGRVIIFKEDTTTTNLQGQTTTITGGTAASNTLEFSTLTDAPVSGDTFIVV